MIPSHILDFCTRHDLVLTPIRQILLGHLWHSGKACKAYDLIDVLRENGIGSPKPPTVYRAIEFLESHGLVHKIHSINAWLPCHHPGIHKGCQFLICDVCENVTEFCDHDLEHRIPESARRQGFIARASILEVCGRCTACQDVA